LLEQSLLSLQDFKHPSTEQRMFLQSILSLASHLPDPSQVLAGVYKLPSQTASPQTLDLSAFWQAPPLPQRPVVPQGLVACSSMQIFFGSGFPAITDAQLPFPALVSAFLHEVQASVHAPLQQNPSTQKPVAHSLASVQTEPLSFLVVQVFVLLSQKLCPVQSESALQLF
jgi:hypothetical protein